MALLGMDDMSLPYQMVFYLLLSEIGLFTIVLFPWPQKWRRRLLTNLARSSIATKLRSLIKVCFLVVCLLFTGKDMSDMDSLMSRFFLSIYVRFFYETSQSETTLWR
jgi:hypothetical protein